MTESLNVTVREGDSFDELYLNYEKPWGTAHDFSSSVLVADIKERFSELDTVETFGIVRLPTPGQIKLSLTARQTNRLARFIELGYSERDIFGVVNRFGDPGVTIAEFPDAAFPFLWDLKEFWYQDVGAIVSITQGTDLDPTPEGSLFPLVITTDVPHGLTEEDSIRISGTTVPGYNQALLNNTLVVLSATQFYVVPDEGIPQWSQNSSGGIVQVLKEDTVCIGTLRVIPRISQQ